MHLNFADFILFILNSNFFVGFVTLAAGSVALFLYKKQKNDHKRNIANIILLEIQSAEQTLKQVSEAMRADQPEIPPDKKLLPTNTWFSHRGLFVSDFDRNEWDNITDFYHYCEIYDRSVDYDSSFFQKNEEQIRINTQSIFAKYLGDYMERDMTGETEAERLAKWEFCVEKAKEFQNLYLSVPDLVLYNPKKPSNDAKAAFDNLNQELSLSVVGQKLKKLAGYRE